MSLKEIKKATEPLYIAPKNIQQLLNINKISHSGLFELKPGIYSKVYTFDDINYEILTDEEQTDIYERFCEFLNSMDTYFTISIFNKKFNEEEFEENILIEEKDDVMQIYRESMNEEIYKKVLENQKGVEQIMLLTVTVKRSNFEEARAYFATLEAFLEKSFMELNSDIRAFSGEERLRTLQEFYQMGNEQMPPIEMENYFERCQDWAADVMGNYLKKSKNNSYLEINGRYVQALYLSYIPRQMNDRFVKKITELPIKMMFTVEYEPIPKDVAKDFAELRLFGIDNKISNRGKQQVRNNEIYGEIPRKVQRQKDDVVEVIDRLSEDFGAMLVGVTVVVMADNEEELKQNVTSIKRVCNQYDCKLEEHYLEQLEAVSTALPIGLRLTEKMKFMLTPSAAVFNPFSAEEFKIKKGTRGIYYGINQISKKLLYGDRKKIANGNGIVLGIPGAGKSMCIKQEYSQYAFGTEDRIISIDPANEMIEIAKAYGGVNIDISSASCNYLNPLDCDISKLNVMDTHGILRSKCEFMLGFCEMALRNVEVTSFIQSLVDECVRSTYAPIIEGKKKEIPTLSDFQAELNKRGEEGKFIAGAIDIFVNGSLNIFNHRTNINKESRIINFPIRDMSESLKGMGMYVMLETIKEIVLENARRGIATILIVDEFHNILGHEYAETYFYSLIKEVRKLGGLVTCATQNVADVLQSYKASTMFENCDYVVMLKMSPQSAKKLTTLVEGMSEGHVKYISRAKGGTGVVKFGKTIVPIDMRIDKNSLIYKMFNTNFHEKHGSAC